MNLQKQAQAFISLYRDLRADIDSIADLRGELPPGLSIGAYSELYDVSVHQLGAYLFKQMGVLGDAEVAASGPDPNSAMVEFAREIEPECELDGDQALITFVAMRVMLINMISITLFHLPVSGLLACVSGGDDEALFKAVVLDASITNSKPIANRIATAAFCNDRSFLKRLAKAIIQTKPARPKEHLDELRLLMQFLDDAGALESMTDDELTEWSVNKVLVLPDKGDALQVVRRQRRAREAAKCQ